MAVSELQRVRRGWPVLGSDGRQVGEIETVAESHLVVQSGLIFKRRLYVPFDAIVEVGRDSVVLNVPATDAKAAGWQAPPGSPSPRPRRRTKAGGATDMTTMTGAGYGAGGGVAAAGPLDPTRGDSIDDRVGGSGRAGLGHPTLGTDEEIEPGENADQPERQ